VVWSGGSSVSVFEVPEGVSRRQWARLLLVGPIIVILLLAGALSFIYVFQHPGIEDDPSTIEDEDEHADPLMIIPIVLIGLTFPLMNYIRDAFSRSRLVVTDDAMVFDGKFRYPRDRTVYLYVKPVSSLMLGPNGHLVGAPRGPPTQSLVFAVDLEGGAADWFEVPVALQGGGLSRVLERLRGCLPGLIVSARPEW